MGGNGYSFALFDANQKLVWLRTEAIMMKGPYMLQNLMGPQHRRYR